MKIPAILSPCNTPEEVPILIKAGASELFFGVLDEAWEKRYSNIASPNRREWKSSNISRFESASLLCQTASRLGASAYMTLNAFYTPEQEKFLHEYIDRAIEINPSGFIVADPGVIALLRNKGFTGHIHISTGGAVFNSEAVNLYRDMGASRIILPRHNTIDEISRLSQSSNAMEFEAFIMNRGCKNIDAYCTFHHGINEIKLGRIWNIPKKLKLDQAVLDLLPKLPGFIRRILHRQPFALYDGACFIPYRITIKPQAGVSNENIRVLHNNLTRTFGMETARDTCGACALWYFLRHSNLSSVKIVGRNNKTSKKISDIIFIRQCILNARQDDSFENYSLKTISLYRKIYGHNCEKNCYYPF